MKGSLKKNFFYNLIFQILVLVIPLVTTPYVSRVLESDGIGTYSYILSIVTYFVIFGSLGVSMYGQREIAYVQENEKKRSIVFFEIVLIRFITMFVAGIMYYLIFARTGSNHILYKLFIFEILANIFDINWFFQGMEEFKKIVVRNIIIKILGIIAIFLFVNTKEDLSIYILIYVLSNLLSNASLWLYLPKYICKVSFKNLKLTKRIKPIIAMFIPQIAIQIYTVLDKTMLGTILQDMNEVGYYEQALKTAKMGMAVITAFATVMSPKIAKAASNNDEQAIEENLMKSFRVVWLFGSAIMFGVIGIVNNFVPWFFGPGYEPVTNLVIVLSMLVLAIGLNNVSGVQYLIQIRKHNIFTVTVIIGATINFILNLFGIRFLHAMGAAIASVVAETTILIVQLIYMKKHTNINVSKIFIISIKYIISGIVMMVCVVSYGNLFMPTILATICQVLFGAIIYSTMLLLLKDELLINTLNSMMTKVQKFVGGRNEK